MKLGLLIAGFYAYPIMNIMHSEIEFSKKILETVMLETQNRFEGVCRHAPGKFSGFKLSDERI